MCSLNNAITFEIPTIQLSKVKSKKVEITDDKLIEEDLTKEELSNSIGKIIRELRLSKKMSLECLSNETGIGYSQLSRIERGKINTSIYQIYLIIKTLNVPINTLLEVLITDVIRSYKQKNKKYIKNKINKSIMKKITLFLLSCVLLATACNQSNTTPTTPPATVFSIDSSYYFKINFNGQTLYNYAVRDNNLGLVSYPAGSVTYQASLLYYQFASFNFIQINAFMHNANVTFSLQGTKNSGSIGVYNSAGLSITDANTAAIYDNYTDNSTILTIQSIDVAASKITGIISGNFTSGASLIPFTASFCVKKN